MGLKGRRDLFRLLLPKEFLYKDIEEKYTEILRKKNSFYHSPIDFINESIQKVQVLGFSQASYLQQQPKTGLPVVKPYRIRENEMLYPSTDEAYRAPVSMAGLTDKTLNIDFRHTLGFLNYFMIYENFIYKFSRDLRYSEILHNIYVDILNELGEVYCKIRLIDPIFEGIDMLDLDFTQPVAQSETFRVVFKYSDFEIDFLLND